MRVLAAHAFEEEFNGGLVGEWADRAALLGAQPQPFTGGDQDAQRRARSQQIRDQRRRGHHLLEVVDDKQQFLAAEMGDQARRWRLTALHET